MAKPDIYKLSKIALLVGVSLSITACGTTGTHTRNASDAIDTALEKAANDASRHGNTKQSLAYLERIYNRNSADTKVASRYAKALRENGYLDQAEAVMGQLAYDELASSAIKGEFAAIQLERGNNERAKSFAEQAIVLDAENYDAYNYLGVALDAMSLHEDAEEAYRKALDHWTGDPTPVMNNLALNLASQNKLDMAIDILYKAKAIAPDRSEVERNLRIVTALQQSHKGYNPPKPKTKPIFSAKTTPILDLKDDESENEDAASTSAAPVPDVKEED